MKRTKEGFYKNQLGSQLPSYLQTMVSNVWGSEFLNRVPKRKTNKIPSLFQKLSMDDKNNLLSKLFHCSIDSIQALVGDEFHKIITTNKKFREYFDSCLIDGVKINWDTLWLTDIYLLFENILFLPSAKASASSNTLVLTQNISNFQKWLSAYNRITGENIQNPFADNKFSNIYGMLTNNKFDVKLFANNDLYLYVTDLPEEILTMAVGRFYDSCQNLFTGGTRDYLLSNVFDKNIKIAYIVLPVEYTDEFLHKHKYTPICRSILRYFENKNAVVPDRTYPDKCRAPFVKILDNFISPTTPIVKPFELKERFYPINYLELYGLPLPYMDNFSINTDFSRSIFFQKLKQEERDRIEFEINNTVDCNLHPLSEHILAVEDPHKFFTLPEKLNQSVEIAIRKNPKYTIQFINQLPLPLQEIAIRKSPELIKYINDPALSLQLLAIKKNSENLKFIYVNKVKPEVIKYAIINYGEPSIQYLLNNSIPIDPKFARKYFNKYPILIGAIDNPTEKEKWISINHNYSNIQYIKNSTHDMQQSVINYNIGYIEYIDIPFPDVQSQVVHHDLGLIGGIRNPTLEVQKYVIERSPELISSIRNPANEIVMMALKEDPSYICNIANPSAEAQIFAVSAIPDLILDIDHPTFMALAVALKHNGKYLSILLGPTLNHFTKDELQDLAIISILESKTPYYANISFINDIKLDVIHTVLENDFRSYLKLCSVDIEKLPPATQSNIIDKCKIYIEVNNLHLSTMNIDADFMQILTKFVKNSICEL